MSINVVIADDHGLVRQGLKALLTQNQVLDVAVVGEAADGHEAVMLAEKLRPAVLIADISMPGLNGMEATRAALKAVPAMKVIALSMHKHLSYVLGMFEAGAQG